MAAKYEVRKTPTGKFRFDLKATNGQIILSSQNYTAKTSAQYGVGSVRRHCADDGCFERRTAKNGEVYFVLKARNGQIIGTSEMYKTKRAMENGIASVRRNGPDAAVVDATFKK